MLLSVIAKSLGRVKVFSACRLVLMLVTGLLMAGISTSGTAYADSAINLTKSSSTTNYNGAGQSIDYSYLVTNIGTDALDSIAITDDKIPSADITCLVSTLDPGESTSCSGTYTTTQADVDAGSVTNTATASGQNPDSATVTSGASSVTVNALLSSTISMTKSSLTASYDGAGQSLDYSYLVTNTGNTTLNFLSITDNRIPTANISCLATTLAPAEATTCSGTYTTTQANVDVGSVTNTATASAKNPQGGSVVSLSSSVTVNAVMNPLLALVKSSTTASFNAPGVYITYNYLVTNSGNNTINTIALNDDKIPGNISCAAKTLAPLATTTCSAVYITKQADVDAGSITNTGTVTGKNTQGTPVSADSSLTIPVVESPSLNLTKSTATTSYNAAGQNISYSYSIKNSGNQTITNLAITDDKIPGADINCPVGSLAPNASTTCTAVYTTTQADVDTGFINNTASAGGQNQQGTPVVSPSTSVKIYAVLNNSLTLTKSSTTVNFDLPGQSISYSYLVTNTSNNTISNILITDNKIPTADITCSVTSLAPGVSTTCTSTRATRCRYTNCCSRQPPECNLLFRQ